MDDEPDVNYEESRTGAIHAVLSFVIALALLVAGVAAVIVFVITKPEPDKKEEVELVPTVRVQELREGDHRVEIATQGVVGSVREVSLAAEVGGRVISIAPELIEGGSVKEGDVRVEIDNAASDAAHSRAASAAADADLAQQHKDAASRPTWFCASRRSRRPRLGSSRPRPRWHAPAGI